MPVERRTVSTPCRGPTAAAAADNCVSPATEVAATSIALQRPCHHPSPSYHLTVELMNEGYPKVPEEITITEKAPLLAILGFPGVSQL